MNAAPPEVASLSEADLRELVRLARPAEKRARRPRRLAVAGRAPGLTRLEDPEDGPWELVEVQSELDLRERLFGDRRDDSIDRRIFLLAWPCTGSSLPLDLRPSFAGERVLRLVGRERLKARLGGRPVSEDVARSELGALLDTLPLDRLPPYEAPSIDRAGAWRLVLAVHAGLPMLARPDGATLLLWLLSEPQGADAARALSEKPGLARDLDGYLQRDFGPVGPYAWKAWLDGRARAFVLGGLVVNGLLRALRLADLAEAESGAVNLLLTQLRRKQQVENQDQVLSAWGEAAAEALADLLTDRRRATALGLPKLLSLDARAALREADRDADALPPRLLSASRLLPSGLRERLADFAQHAQATATREAPPAESLEMTQRLLKAVEDHVALGPTDPARRAAVIVGQLLAFLVCLRRRTLTGAPAELLPGGATSSLEAWARYQATHGGPVDRLLRELSGLDVPALAPAAHAVRSAVLEVRERANRGFGARLQTWHRAGAPSDSGVPLLHEVGKRVIARWLEDDDDRTLLVLLMDGLAWGVASELFQHLKALGWGAVPAAGEELAGVALADLPTITSVSRSAFFSGRAPVPGTPEPSSDRDPTRWAEHPDLSRWKPELFLKRTLGIDATLPAQVADTIRDRGKRLVGVVVNAVDDWLSGPQQIQQRFDLDAIKPLRALLAACQEVDRSILVVADHGHTRNESKWLAGESEHSRWRPVGEPAAVGQELVFEGSKVWSPPGTSGVVLPIVSGTTYTFRKVGHHGGATLDEVVVPLVLLQPGGAAIDPPHWWDLEAGAAVEPAKAAGTAPGELFDPAPAAGGLSSKLKASPVWSEHEKLLPGRFPVDRLYALLDAMERRPRLSSVEFTEITGEREHRLAGFVSQAGRALNLGGQEILRYDSQQRRVLLDLELLCQVFEVDRG